MKTFVNFINEKYNDNYEFSPMTIIVDCSKFTEYAEEDAENESKHNIEYQGGITVGGKLLNFEGKTSGEILPDLEVAHELLRQFVFGVGLPGDVKEIGINKRKAYPEVEKSKIGTLAKPGAIFKVITKDTFTPNMYSDRSSAFNNDSLNVSGDNALTKFLSDEVDVKIIKSPRY